MSAPATDTGRPSPVTSLLILLLRGWQMVPKLDPNRCRFYPTCSRYGVEALRRHGLFRGLRLTVWRVARCHPFHPGGVDHVPERTVQRAMTSTDPEGSRHV